MNKFVKTVTRTVVETEVDWAGIADAVEVLVMEKLKRDLEQWSENRAMRAMFLRDAGDGLSVCETLATGDWTRIDRRLWEMDTAARDYLYDFIGQVAGDDFFRLIHG